MKKLALTIGLVLTMGLHAAAFYLKTALKGQPEHKQAISILAQHNKV